MFNHRQILFLSALAFLFSCSTGEVKKDSAPKQKLDLKALETSCKQGTALSCARLGYHFQNSGDINKANYYYTRGCELKDETSCHNLKGVSRREAYFKKADGVMKHYSNNIKNCHRPDLKGKNSQIQLKETWHKVDLAFMIDPKGKAKGIDIESDLGKGFLACVKKVISGIKFPRPQNLRPYYRYGLTIASHE